MLGALAASSQSARGLFISRSLNSESCVNNINAFVSRLIFFLKHVLAGS